MANDKATIGPFEKGGEGYNFCLSLLCIPMVGVTRACSLGSFHICRVRYLEIILGSLSILVSELFEWVWVKCCRVYSWDCVVCICLGGNYGG